MWDAQTTIWKSLSAPFQINVCHFRLMFGRREEFAEDGRYRLFVDCLGGVYHPVSTVSATDYIWPNCSQFHEDYRHLAMTTELQSFMWWLHGHAGTVQNIYTSSGGWYEIHGHTGCHFKIHWQYPALPVIPCPQTLLSSTNQRLISQYMSASCHNFQSLSRFSSHLHRAL